VAIVYLDDANPVSAATSVTPSAVAASLAAGDHAFICVDFKRPGSATLATPGGWTKIVDAQVGTGTPGAGDGPIGLMVFYAQVDASGTLTLPTLTLGGTTTGSLIQAGLIVYRGDLGIGSFLDYAIASGSDTTSGTGFSVTGDVDPGLTTNDRLLVFGALTTGSTITFTANPSFTSTGVTYGTVSSPWLTSTNTGDDARSFCYRATATAGTSSAAPVVAGTLDGNSTGGAAFLRFRERAFTDTGTLTEGASVLTVIGTASDSATLSESAVIGTPVTGDDSGTLIESAEVSIVVTKAASDSGALTEGAAGLIDVVMKAGSDSGALSEGTSVLSVNTPKSGSDSGALTDSSALTQIREVTDEAALSETALVDRPPISDDSGTLIESSQLTVNSVGTIFYFGPDQYFGEGQYFGGDTSVLPEDALDGGFTASRSEAPKATPVYTVLVVVTTTGAVVDELAVSQWSYTESIDWVRPGSMTVSVPLLGKDRAGRLNKDSLRSIRGAMVTVSLVLTRDGRALWAGPVYSMSWNDEAVEIGCASVTKLMDARVVVDEAYLEDPTNPAGNVSLDLAPRDRVLRLLDLGTTGTNRELPLELPALSGEAGSTVEYLSGDLGTVSERIKEAVEADGGPDVILRPELNLTQDTLVWKAQVEESLGSPTPVAAWDYPISVAALTGDLDASEMVTTGYVLGDTQTNEATLRGVGVASATLDALRPALERADRTSVSNKLQQELDALATSYVAAHSTAAETWSIVVHPDAEPIIGEQWNLGDVVVISVSDHPWLDDGEYLRRVVGVTHSPDSMTLETTAVMAHESLGGA
jgi:hypothetical protein